MSYTIALAGNPNCGKTTLFNALTGANQYVGNWAGVTVEKREGSMTWGGRRCTIVDLPGIYSLSAYTIEEVCARDYLLWGQPDAVLNIVDGTNLERNLYLTLQLLELKRPLVVAINLMDEVQARGGQIDCQILEELLGVPVLPISARNGAGLNALCAALLDRLQSGRACPPPGYEAATCLALKQIEQLAPGCKPGWASLLLGGDPGLEERLMLTPGQRAQLESVVRQYVRQAGQSDRETALADSRYRLIAKVVQKAVRKGKAPRITATQRLDAVLTNRVLAIPIFLALMAAVFMLVFGPLGCALRDGVQALISQGIAPFFALLLKRYDAPKWLESLVLEAIFGGVGSVLSFLPQIMLLFLFLSLLEDSGYMARAAFLMDRPLRRLGLTGKSFIPMLMGFGCTTPAVLAARAVGSEKDRRFTIFLIPYLSCGARLPIYALFAGAFFPQRQGLVVFLLYFTGALVGAVMGMLLRRTTFGGRPDPFVMELPPYRRPTLRGTLRHTWEKGKGFVVKAGTVLFLMSLLIWLMQSFDTSLRPAPDSMHSMFGQIGVWLAPALKPLGFGSWQAAVALLSGIVAKEAVVSTLGVVYGAQGAGLALALQQQFTPLTACSFLVFALLYCPCTAALAAIRRELGSWKGMLAVALLQTGTAYAMSLLVYQVGGLLGLG